MKMLFFSSEREEVELLRREFVQAGIPCEVRAGGVAEGNILPNPRDAELWIQNDEDAHRAYMLCAELSLGFAKRAAKAQGLAA